MVVGFLGEAAWQSTPKRSKTVAAQRLSSTFRWSEWLAQYGFANLGAGAGPAIAHLRVMRNLKITVVAAVVAGVGWLLALVLWNSAPAVEVRIVGSESAGMLDDTGAEMRLMTLAVSRQPHSNDALYFWDNHAKVEARVSGHWSEVQNSFSLATLGANSTREALLLVPRDADLCRIHLRYARASLRWRLGGLLWHCGIKMPPKYWAWAGWPHAEGKNPRWREIRMEFPFAPSSSPATGTFKGSHNEAMHRMSGTRVRLQFDWLWMPLIGDLDRSKLSETP